jgi:hypothetical protein
MSIRRGDETPAEAIQAEGPFVVTPHIGPRLVDIPYPFAQIGRAHV